ncbi:MAG TPA: GNAT family N-acetyltransferase [Gemmatimonadales bacterium]|jgi:N-acetylglutamate synthase-like GNAT family acetyltransferase|nr:GNAT family N-acetyltransferase [Gemmatimonadales bacterium]
MDDAPVAFRRGDFSVTTDRGRMNPDAALALLRTTVWGQDMSRETLVRAMANSVSFALMEHDVLIGFGRVVTDLATYAYWTDVVIAPMHRGRGLGRWLSECMLAHPDLQGLRRVTLLTRDAAGLYASIGFTTGSGPLVYMEHRP